MSESERPHMDVTELRLRLLHELIDEANESPGFLVPYIRFLRSLRERTHPVGLEDLRVIELTSGLRFKIDLGDRLGCDFYYGYYQELFDSLLWLSLVEEGDVVFDIGANFGYYTIMAARAVGLGGCVHAFEPNQKAYDLLRDNVSLNDVQNSVKCYFTCLGDADGVTDFYLTEESSFSGLNATGRSNLIDKVQVPIARLDTFVAKNKVTRVAALKIDVEGYEFAVLEGAINTIKSNYEDLIIMMEVSSKNLDDERLNLLKLTLERIYALGLKMWYLAPLEEELKSIDDLSDIFVGGSSNVFLLKSDSRAFHKLQDKLKLLKEKNFDSLASKLFLSTDSLRGRENWNSSSSSGVLSTAIGEITSRFEEKLRHCHASLKEKKLQVRDMEGNLKQCTDSLEEKTLENQRLQQKLDLYEQTIKEKIIRLFSKWLKKK